MRKMKYVVGLIVILSCVSCVASRNMETQKRVDYSGDFLKIGNELSSLRADIKKATETTNERLSNLKLEQKIAVYSPPDSTGKQYLMQTNETNIHKEDKSNTHTNEVLLVNMNQMYSRMDSLYNKISTLVNEKQKVIELSWWDLHKDTIYCILLIGILLIVVLGKIKKKYLL